jgi:hypothetical protein
MNRHPSTPEGILCTEDMLRGGLLGASREYPL